MNAHQVAGDLELVGGGIAFAMVSALSAGVGAMREARRQADIRQANSTLTAAVQDTTAALEKGVPAYKAMEGTLREQTAMLNALKAENSRLKQENSVLKTQVEALSF